jgi:hypothetical protein
MLPGAVSFIEGQWLISTYYFRAVFDQTCEQAIPGHVSAP